VLPIDASLVDPDDLRAAVTRTTLVSIMLANNGPAPSTGRRTRRYRPPTAYAATDAAQAVSKIPVDVGCWC
jgi:cysteine sulfinate desulfinase/cysteine desulfurase-like protein